MNWTVDKKKQVAQSEHGYRISWCKNKHGTWFNARSNGGKHLASGYDEKGRDLCKKACEAHWMMSQPE